MLIEEKYKQSHSAWIDTKLFFATNHPLRLAAYDKASVDRIVLLPFTVPILKAQQDLNLDKNLQREKSGILYKAILAYQVLQRNNFRFTGSDIYNGHAALATMDSSSSTSNPMEEFIELCCKGDADAFTSTDALYKAYSAFC